MRTKIFLAFIFIVFFALLSNIVFEKLIIEDFNEYVRGTAEDNIYWILASVEGSYNGGMWNRVQLHEALHWGLMLGFESYIEDISGNRILSSKDVLSLMNADMKKRMNSILKLEPATAEFSWYPMYVKGEEIGKLYVRPLEKLGLVAVKEATFRKRGREFLLVSFLIAGGGALFLSFLFTIFLSKPLRRLTDAAEKIARGDFAKIKPVEHRLRLFHQKDEIDKLTKAFNYMAEALKREDALRKHLCSNVAHELRTPLTIIKGNLEAIEDGVIADPRAIIANINSEIERMISLIEGIEDVTSAEASFFKKGDLEEVELHDFIETVAEGMRKIAEEKGLYLLTEGPGLTVKTYPEKLHIILKNLLTNACKFTDKGGIKIQWTGENGDKGAGFGITVKDTGRGMEEDELKKVFERFYKGRGSGGRGLGLAIVKELSEVMDGDIEVKSFPGKGSEFRLTFKQQDA